MKVVSISLRRLDEPGNWVNIALSLQQGEYCEGQKYVPFADNFSFDIKPLDNDVAEDIIDGCVTNAPTVVTNSVGFSR
jgi:hypothetical protein